MPPSMPRRACSEPSWSAFRSLPASASETWVNTAIGGEKNQETGGNAGGAWMRALRARPGARGSELHHVPHACAGGGLGAVARTVAHAVGGLHLVFGQGAHLGLHGDALCLPAHAQFVDAAATVFHADALGALVQAVGGLLLF